MTVAVEEHGRPLHHRVNAEYMAERSTKFFTKDIYGVRRLGAFSPELATSLASDFSFPLSPPLFPLEVFSPRMRNNRSAGFQTPGYF